jgi:nitroreductase
MTRRLNLGSLISCSWRREDLGTALANNPIIDLLLDHRSVRRFKREAIPRKRLNRIIQAGIRSSSSGNMQSWSVIATSDSNLKKRLFRLHHEQAMILEAPYVLTFCADFHRMSRWLKLRKARSSFDDLTGFLVAAIDAVIAAQSVALAAESEGLGICYMGTTLYNTEKISELLRLPDLVFPVASMVIGVPAERPAPTERLPLESILHEQRYSEPSDRELLRFYRERELKGWRRYLAREETSAAIFRGAIKNLAAFYTSEFKYGKGLHARTSREILSLLKKKKFWNFSRAANPPR